MSVTEDCTATLRAETHGHLPIILDNEENAIPINTMVATRCTDEKRTCFGVGEPNEPSYTLQEAHSHAVAYHPKTAGTLCASAAGLNRPSANGAQEDFVLVYGLCSTNSNSMLSDNPDI